MLALAVAIPLYLNSDRLSYPELRPSSSVVAGSGGFISVYVVQAPGMHGNVHLVDASGRTTAPLNGPAPADQEEHRINFEVDAHGSYQVVPEAGVTVRSSIRYSTSTRIAGKLLGAWPGFYFLAAVALAGALIGARSLQSRWTGGEVRLLPWLALLAYALVVAPHLDPYAGGSDSSGYLNSARLLRDGHWSVPLPRPAGAVESPSWKGPATAADRMPAVMFIPLGFALQPTAHAGGETMVPTYPVGLPLMIALASAILPISAAVPATILFHLLLGILLTYALARSFSLSPRWSLVLAAVLALSPLYLFMGLQTMSDVAALAWIAAAVVLARRPTPSAAIAAGAATAIAILVRPTNALAVPLILLALGAPSPRWLAWIVGGIPFGLLLAVYNFLLYGHPLTTGYGDVSTLFAAHYVLPTLRHYLVWLPQLLTPAVLLVVLLPFRRGVQRSSRVLLVLWIVCFLGLYSAYYCTHETWWYLRFILPAFPALLIGAALALASPVPAVLARPWLGTLAVVAVFACLWHEDMTLPVLDSGAGNRVYLDSSAWLARNAPPDALVVCGQNSGALYYYTHLQIAKPQDARDAGAVLRLAERTHRPIYASIFPFEQSTLGLFTGGHWSPVYGTGDVSVWRLDVEATPSSLHLPAAP
jgi:hypothetical protein